MVIQINKIIYNSRLTAEPIKAVTSLFHYFSQYEIIMIKISKRHPQRNYTTNK